jgi:iron(III) transport system permease protein
MTDILPAKSIPRATVAGVARGPFLRWLTSRWDVLALATILAFLTIVPVITVIVGSLRPFGLPLSPGWTVQHYVSIWSAPYTYTLLFNTLVFAVGSTIVALMISTLLAWLIERTDLPGAELFKGGLIIPMLTPPLLLGMGWVLLLNNRIGIIPNAWADLFGQPLQFSLYSLGGMIFVQSLTAVPTAFLMLSPVVKNMDPSFEEAAYMSGATFSQTLRRVSLPFLIPPMMSVATLLLIVTMLAFDVPAVIGMPANINVMSSEVFNLMNPASGVPAFGKAAALNASLFLPLMLALAFYYRVTRRLDQYATVTGKSFKATRVKLGRAKPFAVGFVVGYFLLAVVLPFLALLWMSLLPYFAGIEWEMFSRMSLAAYREVFSRPQVWHASLNSTIVAATAGVGVTVLSFLVAWTIVRSKVWWVWTLDVMAMIPLAIPYLMMGVALIFIALTLRALPLYGTIWVIALGHIAIFLPIGVRMMQAAVIQIHKELEEAATVSGASRYALFRRVLVPLIKPSIYGLMVWLVVHSFREFSIAVMLRTNRNEVLSTVLYSYWETGSSPVAAAIAVLLMLVLILVVFVTKLLGLQGKELN